MDDNAPAPQAVEPTSHQVQPVAVEDNSSQPSPVAEPTTSVEQAPEGQVEPAPINEPAAPAPSEAERQVPRAERRINQLTGQLKELTATQQVVAPIPGLSPQSPKLSEMLQGQDSIDPADLDKIGEKVYESAAQTARGLNSMEVQQLRNELTQQRAVDGVEKDAAILPTQYEELNPDSPKYNPILEEKIESAYKQRAVRPNPYNPSQMMVDPSVRLTDVAKDLVELARASVEQGQAQTSASLATHSDNSAVTPTSDTVAEKSVTDMSLSEHEAYLKAKGYDI